MATEQEYTPITIHPEIITIEIDYTDESKFKAGMQELKAQMRWMRQCKDEIESQHKRLVDEYNDCMKIYIDSDADGYTSTRLGIPRHLAKL